MSIRPNRRLNPAVRIVCLLALILTGCQGQQPDTATVATPTTAAIGVDPSHHTTPLRQALPAQAAPYVFAAQTYTYSVALPPTWRVLTAGATTPTHPDATPQQPDPTGVNAAAALISSATATLDLMAYHAHPTRPAAPPTWFSASTVPATGLNLTTYLSHTVAYLQRDAAVSQLRSHIDIESAWAGRPAAIIEYTYSGQSTEISSTHTIYQVATFQATEQDILLATLMVPGTLNGQHHEEIQEILTSIIITR